MIILIILFLLLSSNLMAEPRADILIADFESGSYAGWTIVSGNAFGSAPASGALAGQMAVTGYEGNYFINTFLGGDRSTGVLESDPFVIDRTHIYFLIGGGANGGCRMELLIDGVVVRTITPEWSAEELRWNWWEVTDLQGKTAQLRIIDNETGGWGHINVDYILQSDNYVIANFDQGDYEGWVSTGNAFGNAPAVGALNGQWEVKGFGGTGLVNTFLDGDASTGTLTSPSFTIMKPYINFRIGGGFDPKTLYVELIVDDTVIYQTTPIERKGRADDTWQERLYIRTWEVANYIGKNAIIKITDNSTGGWGHINVDDFVQSDIRASLMSENLRWRLKAQAQYLMVPVQNDADMMNMILRAADSTIICEQQMRFARNTVDRYMPVYVGAHIGDSIEVYLETYCTTLSYPELFHTSDDPGFTPTEEDPYRPLYHHTPAYGWMNDPNGMVYHKGRYHLFYQHFPYGTSWNDMHWGHASSTDLIHWEQHPIALFPDEYGGMFSGSIVIDEKNTAGFGSGALVAIYTSTHPTQSQSIAYSLDDGMTWHKYGAPVLKGSGDFRDPKVFWNQEQNSWTMILAAGQQVKIYSSPDLKRWTLKQNWGTGIGSHAGVWECPDLIQVPVEGTNEMKWVMLVSINPGGPSGGSATQYFIGDFANNKFVLETDTKTRWLDFGKDNYAGVTWFGRRDSKNRPLFIGWMNNWQYADAIPLETSVFCSSSTFPRALSLVNTPNGLCLKSEPVSTLGLLRSNAVYTSNVGKISQTWTAENISELSSGAAIVECQFGNERQGWKLTLSNDNGESVVFSFQTTTNRVSLDRKKSGHTKFNANFAISAHTGTLHSEEHAQKAMILIDRSSVELFINDGRMVLTDLVFPTTPYTHLSIEPTGGTLDVEQLQVTAVTLDQYTGLQQPNAESKGATIQLIDGQIVICTSEGKKYNILGVLLNE